MKLYDNKCIVVTGGAGFIGSCVIAYLNEQGIDSIVVVDNLEHNSDKWKNLIGKRFLEIVPIHECFSYLEGRETEIEAIIHLGACSDTLEKNNDYLLTNNYRFSIRLCEYACTHNHRFIYASSAATYGDGSLGFSDNHEQLLSLKPLNMYGFSKHLFDLWAQKRGILTQIVGLKYFNVFGPNEYHKGRMASAVYNLLPKVVHDEEISLFASDNDLFGNGEQKRDFIYIKDAARMTCQFLENSESGIFNIGTGNATSWNSLAEAVFAAAHKKPKIRYIPLPDDLKGKYQYFTQADMKKTKHALGTGVKCMTISDAVSDYVQNYLLSDSRW